MKQVGFKPGVKKNGELVDEQCGDALLIIKPSFLRIVTVREY